MSPRNRYVDSHSQVASSTIFAAVRCSSSLGPKRKRSSASSSRPVPATTPYRRPVSSRRACTSKIARIPAVPLRSAPSSIVSSYWSVNNALLGSCGAAVFTARTLATSRPVAPVWHHGGMRAAPVLRDDRVERPGQPHVLRHLRLPAAVRLQPAEGHGVDARRPPQGSGRGL